MFYDTDSGRIFVDGLLQEYLPIIILLGMAIGLGVILLLAMIGAIVLTYRKREGVKKQSYINQISRERETSIEVVEADFNTGVKIDD